MTFTFGSHDSPMTESSDDNWYRVLLLVDEADGERAASSLWNLGAAGVEIRDRETFVEADDAKPVPEGKAELSTFFSSDRPVEPESVYARVEEALAAERIVIDTGEAYEFTDTSWQTSWKDYFQPVHLSSRCIVGPPWETFDAPDDGIKLIIEPGMAFGTGGHETTQLCATLLDERLAARRGLDVLDVGCGSAVLSMLARRLGAGRVVGIDNDPTAIDVARENLAVNDMVDDLELSITPVDQIDDVFDIVVANILTHVLLDLRDALRSRVAPAGELILSGITTQQLDSIRDAFADDGWIESDVRVDGEWCAITLHRS